MLFKIMFLQTNCNSESKNNKRVNGGKSKY